MSVPHTIYKLYYTQIVGQNFKSKTMKPEVQVGNDLYDLVLGNVSKSEH